MSDKPCETLDPRIRRTRHLLQQALHKLLEEKEFERISVHDIADEATVNRATFYDHYADKFALLECLVASRFHQLLAKRQVNFDGACPSTLLNLIVTLCEYLNQIQGKNEPKRQIQPHMESAIIAVLRRSLLDGMAHHPPSHTSASPALVAAAGAWAIYGGAREWAQTSEAGTAEEFADTFLRLIAPVLLGQVLTNHEPALQSAPV